MSVAGVDSSQHSLFITHRSPLFPSMISCANLSPDDIVLKKMLYLYITHYATSVPDLALLAINQV